jgi:hypothetical protein
MSIKIRVRGGTAMGSENLCRTCRKATFIKGHAWSKELVYCGELSEYVKFPVFECSAYDDKNLVSLGTMKEVAWILVPKKGQPMGFVSQQDFRRMRAENHEAASDLRYTRGSYDPLVDDDD